MFVNVARDYIEYSDSGIYPRYPIPVQPVQIGTNSLFNLSPNNDDYRRLNKTDFNTRLGNDLARKLANVSDKIWFLNPDMDTGCPIFNNRLGAYQVGSVDALTHTYYCDHIEAEELIREGVDHDPAQQAWVNGMRVYVKDGGNPATFEDGLQWNDYAHVFAWLMGYSPLRDMHILQALGFDFDEAQRMDAEFIDWHSNGSNTILCQARADQFIENVYLASKIALDSAQPVTIDVGPTPQGKDRPSQRITFENVRLSPQVAGLRITLPTDGIVFLRDAGLHPETGDVARLILGQWKRMPKRTLARRLIESTMKDIHAMSAAQHYGFQQPIVLSDFWNWEG